MTAGPTTDRPLPPRPRGAAWTRLAVALLAVGALCAMGIDAAHGVRTTVALAGDRSVATARLDDAYYHCLAVEAHSLARPGETVDVLNNDTAAGVTLGKAVAPWAALTTNAAKAGVLLTLFPWHGDNSCLGSIVVARYPSGAVRLGTGQTLEGGPPPQPPL
jgi:hypothetical protein